MYSAIEAVAADRAALLGICAGLDDQQWEAPSGCAGWTVKDVITHLGNLFWMVADGAQLPDTSGIPTEQAQEIGVQARRALSAAEALADYEKVSEVGLAKLAELAALDVEVPLGDDFGTYSTRVLPCAYAFDHYTHIRADLFGPRGPLGGDPPPSDELRVGACPGLDRSSLAAAVSGRCRAVQPGDPGHRHRSTGDQIRVRRARGDDLLGRARSRPVGNPAGAAGLTSASPRQATSGLWPSPGRSRCSDRDRAAGRIQAASVG